SGMAMAFAEISRPASGLEHYFSHFWEMQALQRGEDSDLHGIQVGIGTLLTIWLYEQFLKTECPDTEKARRKMSEFSDGAWEASVREIFGPMADSIFETERMTGKNLPETQKKHLEMIVSHWDEIQKIIREELPAMKTVRGIMLRCGLPVRPSQIGISHEETVNALVGSRDMRDKYMTSSLLWDLGLLDEAAEKMRKTEEIL
ncbi:MAG: iron-containing alcohol dehydrogenase, partial [Clostridia bacterium]|nr:iron-containing alcohol dehydrogenase [Clostridia bacterium]